jgi:hypothetical protein
MISGLTKALDRMTRSAGQASLAFGHRWRRSSSSVSLVVRRIRAREARVGRLGLACVADLARVASLGLSPHTEGAKDAESWSWARRGQAGPRDESERAGRRVLR